MGHFGDQITAILTAIIGVAILAVILSKNSNTVGVIASASQGFSAALGTAVSPITGGNSFGPTAGFAGSGINGYGIPNLLGPSYSGY
jgi:hypothetical protein